MGRRTKSCTRCEEPERRTSSIPLSGAAMEAKAADLCDEQIEEELADTRKASAECCARSQRKKHAPDPQRCQSQGSSGSSRTVVA